MALFLPCLELELSLFPPRPREIKPTCVGPHYGSWKRRSQDWAWALLNSD